MSTFSTHVLDAVPGRPAAGMDVVLTLADGSTTALRTDDDGR
ncbi:MAG: hydroxyisourate hydrolase, partial [Blastococcus sp.]|nr:hydroxyisourate hydrolase [Blastococcus sp.]